MAKTVVLCVDAEGEPVKHGEADAGTVSQASLDVHACMRMVAPSPHFRGCCHPLACITSKGAMFLRTQAPQGQEPPQQSGGRLPMAPEACRTIMGQARAIALVCTGAATAAQGQPCETGLGRVTWSAVAADACALHWRCVPGAFVDGNLE